MNPNPIETLLLAAESYVAITWKRVCHRAPSSFDLHCLLHSQRICFTCVRWQLQNTVYYPGGTEQSQDSLAGENGSEGCPDANKWFQSFVSIKRTGINLSPLWLNYGEAGHIGKIRRHHIYRRSLVALQFMDDLTPTHFRVFAYCSF